MAISAFVVRPFGSKSNVDFERVHRELIGPALVKAGVEGSTTQEILEAGNIREDMFRQLAVAGLVVADVSVHNANVFYELGVRHALRERRTFLIRANVDVVPFDLLTDRYLVYDKDNPAAAVEALVNGIKATLESDAADSPVFKLLRLDQSLVLSELARLLEPPDDFREEVHRASEAARIGDLSLLAEEAKKLPWAREGLRLVGEAQFRLAAFGTARFTWEDVLAYDSSDIEANGRLATIYQKQGDLAAADLAVERVLRGGDVHGPQRAELEALRGSNLKTRWLRDWQEVQELQARSEQALRSPWLEKALNAYGDGFVEDRNHFYSGLNALCLATIRLQLSERVPQVWSAAYESDAEAITAQHGLRRSRVELLAGVGLARDSARRLVEFRGQKDPWLDLSSADLTVLSPGATPERVRDRYRRALSDAKPFHFAAARRQLQMLQQLDVVATLAEAGLAVVDELAGSSAPEGAATTAPSRILLFTGHRIDAPGRTDARFPARSESKARTMIADAIAQESAASGDNVLGLAGGASGGDILFHEICAERGIKTVMYLAGSRDAYVTNSVQDGGPAWVHRFNTLLTKLPSRVLGNSQLALQQPRWLRQVKDYSIWERSNRWMLHNALVYGADEVTLIALWNGKSGDGPGGTKDMAESGTARGAKVVVLDAKQLVG